MHLLISPLSTENLALILPSLRAVQMLHAEARPDLFLPWADNPETYLDFFRDLLARGHRVLAYRDSDVVVGFLCYEVQSRPSNPFRSAERRGFLHHISVLESHRRRGVGSGLIRAMRAELARQGIDRWATTYWTFNEASAALMRSAGAEPAVVMADGFTVPAG